MNGKKTLCIAAVVLMLLVSLTPLAARNTPFRPPQSDPNSHPWQDDSNTDPSVPQLDLVVNFGGFVITFDLPGFLVPTSLKSSSNTTLQSNPTIHRAKTTTDSRGIRSIVTPKGY